MANDDQIRDEKPQHDNNRKTTKTSALYLQKLIL